MNLSLDVKLQIALRLPRYIQHQLIEDSPVGILCCNEVFKSIKIVPTSSRIICIDYDERLHNLNCIRDLAPVRNDVEEYVEVPHYGQLKQKFPFTPNRIMFDTMNDLLHFYATYGDDIREFKSIRIGAVNLDENIRASLPKLDTITNIGLGDYRDEDLEYIGITQAVEALNCEYSSYPKKVHFPNLKSLRTSDLWDYRSMNLLSLWYTDAGGRNSCLDLTLFPKTLSDLTIDANQGSVEHLDLSQFPLKSLVINGNDSWDICTCVLENKLPATLRKLELGALGGDFKMVMNKNTQATLKKLESLVLKDMPHAILRCIEAPNLLMLSLHRLDGPLETLSYPHLVTLVIEDVETPEEFEVPLTLVSLTIKNPARDVLDLRKLKRLHSCQLESPKIITIHPAQNLEWLIGENFQPFECPQNLLSLQAIVNRDTHIGYNHTLKDLKIEIRGSDVDLVRLVDALPASLLSLAITHKNPKEWSPPGLVDLTRFKDIVSLELSGLKLSDKKVIFPAQLVKLDLYDTEFERIPGLPELTLLSMVSNSLLAKGFDLPPKLIFLDLINNRQDVAMSLDFKQSSLEYLNLACWKTPEELALPATLKVLYLDCDIDDLDWIDAALCKQLTVIHQ